MTAAGTVIAIYIAPQAESTMTAVRSVRAIPGQGLEGDRYGLGVGTFSGKPKPHLEVTLIEQEAIDAVSRDYNVTIEPGETRRNLVTRNVALNHLVAREFSVGDVRLRGVKLCEPCRHLDRLTRSDLSNALVHRGGLRCQVLTGGVIHIGDEVAS